MINLKVRLKQKWFWLTLIPLLFLFADQCAQLVKTILETTAGDVLYNGAIMTICIEIIGVVFAILSLIGFPVDLTTDGYGDSVRALERTEPGLNAAQEALAEAEDE